MQGVKVEGAQNMLFIGGKEDDPRHALMRECAQNVEAIHAWHLDVEKRNIRRLLKNGRHGGASVSAFSNDCNVGEFTQPENHAAACEGFVVNDQNAHGTA